jgi:hypothetical protein
VRLFADAREREVMRNSAALAATLLVMPVRKM